MKSDFDTYVQNLKGTLQTTGFAIAEKEVNYGRQLIVTSAQEKAVLCVYNGKKGYKLVWGQGESAVKDTCSKLLAGEQAVSGKAAAPHIIFAGNKNFHGLWAGSDESGKGDYFGPLVVAAVCLNKEQATALVQIGVKDCKELTDKKILALANSIKEKAQAFSVLSLKPAAYNKRYAELHTHGENLTLLLSSGHFHALSKVLQQEPDCKWVLIDQFTKKTSLLEMLKEKWPQLEHVQQQPRAEEDIAVAAASVLARAAFLECMQELAVQAGLEEIPKGAGPTVNACAKKVMTKVGPEGMANYVKLHFACSKAIGIR
jgi:ribonuclease HIII